MTTISVRLGPKEDRILADVIERGLYPNTTTAIRDLIRQAGSSMPGWLVQE